MKNKTLIAISIVTALIFFFPTAMIAQEKKEKEVEKKIEKRVMIVTVDDSGKKTVIDTTILDDSDLEKLIHKDGMEWTSEDEGGIKTIKTKDGNVFVISGDDKAEFHVYSKGDNKAIGEDGSVYVIKKGDKDSFSIISIDEEDGGEEKKMNIFIDENVVHTKDGKLIMKSSSAKGHSYIMKVTDDGEKTVKWIEKDQNLKEGQVHIVISSNNEVEDLIIDGDAVITIKDGKVKVDSEGLKMNIKEEGEKKVVKEKKVKK